MNAPAAVAALTLWLASCSHQAETTVQPSPVEGEVVAPVQPGEALVESEVPVVDQSERKEIRWLADGEVFFVRTQRFEEPVPLVYHGETSIRWALREDGAIEVNGRVVGRDLTDLSTEQRQALVQNGGRFESILVRDVGQMSPELVAQVDALSGESLALMLAGAFSGGVRLDLLANLGPRLVGFGVSFSRLAGEQQVDFRTLPRMPRVGSLAIWGTVPGTVSLLSLRRLQDLPRLESLVLQCTRFGDSHTEQLLGLSRLRVLDLGFTPVGDGGLIPLRSLSRLRELDLTDTNVGDPGLAYLRDFPLLRTLRLSSTQVGDEGFAFLRGSTQLRELELGHTRIGDAGLACLQGNSQLRVLLLGHTPVGDAGLASIQELSRLRVLDINSTRITDVGLGSIRNLSELRELYLSNTRISDVGLAHLRGLSRLGVLDLARTAVSDVGLAHLQGLSQLRYLELDGTDVTSEAVEAFRERYPECSVGGWIGLR